MRTNLLAAVFVFGCSAPGVSDGGGDAGCTVESIDDCVQGPFSADCGGARSQPELLCSERFGECYWFSSECRPLYFRPTDCSPREPCCGERDGRPWPFVGGWAPPYDWAVETLVADLGAFGGTPLGPDGPWPIDVRLDPGFRGPGPGELLLRCDGAEPQATLPEICAGSPLPPTVLAYGRTLAVIYLTRPSPAENLYLEIDPRVSPAGAARAVVYRDRGSGFDEEARVCDGQSETDVIAGTLWLNDPGLEPALLHGRFVLEWPSGGRVEGQF